MEIEEIHFLITKVPSVRKIEKMFSGKNPSDVDLSSDFSCPMLSCLDSDASSNLV